LVEKGTTNDEKSVMYTESCTEIAVEPTDQTRIASDHTPKGHTDLELGVVLERLAGDTRPHRRERAERLHVRLLLEREAGEPALARRIGRLGLELVVNVLLRRWHDG
jgi:hypothetical protein